ncbi:T9SS type B sorting domain-containing protein [Algibacter sp. AS12]|uniref:T9SS type B sorting domain-containing protein n=1 Tax=Algibacter sp. AS12 TaxID=3135773 RepID=UPI00398A796A
MRNILLVVFLFALFASGYSQIRLSHNIGTTPIENGMPSCEDDESWARVFKLIDFGISTNEQFIIKSAEVAITKADNGAYIGFSIFSIDSKFPESNPKHLGSGGYQLVPKISGSPEIIKVDFNRPIVVPAQVENILVVVGKSKDFYNPNSAKVFIAGTEFDNDKSWFIGCREYYSYVSTDNLNLPVPNANFYINVTGEKYLRSNVGSNTTLTHNVCGSPIWINQYGRTGGGIGFSKVFSLKDFEISNNEEYIINNGQVAFSAVGAYDVRIQFNFYRVHNDFPASFSDVDLIGSSQELSLPYSSDKYNPITFNLDFDTPIVVPNGVEQLLVEVFHLGSPGYSVAFIAGSEYGNDVSWIRNGYTAGYTSTNLNFYINVTGNVNHVTNNFGMNISNICSEFLKEFSVQDKANVASVIWGFGDPASGASNTSTDLSPFHDFSADGTYNITATVTGKNGDVEVLEETIDVKEPPTAYGINDFYSCEDSYGSGITSSFNLSTVQQQVLRGQSNKVVTFIDGSGNEYETMTNSFTNTIRDRETITVRVAHQNNPCCYSETSFDLIVQPKPNLESIEDLIVCESETSGFASFNLEKVKEKILANRTNIEVAFYFENGQKVDGPLNAVENIVAYEEVISILVTNTDTNCNNKTTFKLKANPLPIANSLADLIGCDDNNDGISEYFDTSNIQVDVLGSQANMEVSYFDDSGNLLPNPLPNPFTNSTTNQETITVRVTNLQTNCYAETTLLLNTASQPQINKPQPLYGCDLGTGFANFDTSNIKAELIGSQGGLKIIYFDASGNVLPSPLPISFQNTQPWSQRIKVKVENELNNLCYSETSFDLIVNDLPMVGINESYFLCNLEPYLSVSVKADLDTYKWRYQDGSIISNTFEANLVDAGNYSLIIGEYKNGIYCENQFDFELVRSVLPVITDVEYKELSDENYIEIFVSGDGDFEYSIDGFNYQSSNRFNKIQGGVYTVSVRDKLGCGEDFDEVTVIDYPKYFTPNGDGINETWQIKGISNYPNAIINIYDRYGKFLKQISANSMGWDGTFNNEKSPNSDYWFTVKLNNENSFSGHFALKR